MHIHIVGHVGLSLNFPFLQIHYFIFLHKVSSEAKVKNNSRMCLTFLIIIPHIIITALLKKILLYLQCSRNNNLDSNIRNAMYLIECGEIKFMNRLCDDSKVNWKLIRSNVGIFFNAKV